jgi:2-polyprenyl-6-methoxyphenol hydroxylase-like FAD-dependent oxidoreductase
VNTARGPRVAVVGAGMGGLAVAATLGRIGLEVQIYEQANRFTRIGAGIQMLPNSMKVLRAIGIEERLRNFAFSPRSYLNRIGETGETFLDLPMSEERYGAPYLCMHRGDLHESLLSLVPAQNIHLGKKLIGLEQRGAVVTLAFAGGDRVEVDVVIGADGLHSTVREILLGPESPRFSGRVAYRAVYPAHLLDRDLGQVRTKWWGKDRHIVIYYTKADRSEIYFVTSVPEPAEWLTPESWSATGDVRELRAAYSTFHEDVRAVLDACPDCHKWAVLDRDPLPRWSDGRIVLLGDACHPMTPYMAQGAATAIEDAAVLARCLDETKMGDVEAALRLYEAHRKPRTSHIQALSSANAWLKPGETGDNTDWLYGYDALTAPLQVPATAG